MPKSEQAWLQFRRRTSYDTFWACINADGVWFDTAYLIDTAMYWCRMFDDEYGNNEWTNDEWMDNIGRDSGYSIVDVNTLRKLWEHDLVS